MPLVWHPFYSAHYACLFLVTGGVVGGTGALCAAITDEVRKQKKTGKCTFPPNIFVPLQYYLLGVYLSIASGR